MYQTLHKELDGWYVVDNRAYRGKIEAASDGDTLSLSISNLMIVVDFDELLEMLEERN